MREKILEKAHAIIQRKGFDALTMKVLASELDISVGKIYTCFAGKDAIFLELEIQFFEEVIATIEAVLAQNEPPIVRLKLILHHYFNYASTHLDLYKLVTSPPKVYSHYIGTDFESIAKQELDSALKAIQLLDMVLKQALPDTIKQDPHIAQQRYLFLFNAMHGLILNSHSPIFPYISNDNNMLVNNRYQQPEKDKIIDQQIDAIIHATVG